MWEEPAALWVEPAALWVEPAGRQDTAVEAVGQRSVGQVAGLPTAEQAVGQLLVGWTDA